MKQPKCSKNSVTNVEFGMALQLNNKGLLGRNILPFYFQDGNTSSPNTLISKL